MLEFKKGDITKMEADVVFNAANTELRHGGGVARAIALAAGEDLERESRKIGYCPLGDFAITTAGKLSAKKVLHIPTIDYKRGERISYEMLEEVLKKAFLFCRENDFKKIVLPLLGTGVVGLERVKVEEIIKRVARDFEDLKIIVAIK